MCYDYTLPKKATVINPIRDFIFHEKHTKFIYRQCIEQLMEIILKSCCNWILNKEKHGFEIVKRILPSFL